uniref:Uncharacterized protein n=1 Tax=Anopheles arabiensis TaxID=7173 RepID=A0A182IES2_ANOAR
MNNCICPLDKPIPSRVQLPQIQRASYRPSWYSAESGHHSNLVSLPKNCEFGIIFKVLIYQHNNEPHLYMQANGKV